MKIKENRLEGAGFDHQKKADVTEPFKANLPDTIIIHYTAGASGESSANTLSQKGGVSAKYIKV